MFPLCIMLPRRSAVLSGASAKTVHGKETGACAPEGTPPRPQQAGWKTEGHPSQSSSSPADQAARAIGMHRRPAIRPLCCVQGHNLPSDMQAERDRNGSKGNWGSHHDCQPKCEMWDRQGRQRPP